jgi:ABC-type phosphate transport system substrate-binding protein
MAELAGVMVGNYFLLECLEREGMVETYRARPTMRGGCDVLLRIFRPAFPDLTGFQDHFMAEVEKVWRCRHERIQPLVEYGAGDDLLYSVTEVVEAETLEQYLARWEREHPGAALPIPLVVRWTTQLCEALDYAHQRGIAHGNIQPSSILVRADDDLLLTNFGMKRITQEADPAVAQVEEGNAAYVAPEQSVGMLSPASDVYAMGVLLYRLFTGQLPYQGEDAGEIAMKHANEPVPSLRAFCPDMPETVEMVARVALAKTPAARFPSAGALTQSLLAALVKDEPPPVLAQTQTITPRRRVRRRTGQVPSFASRLVTLTSVLVVLAGLIGVLLFFAEAPFHLQDLPFLPFRLLHDASSLRTSPTTGVTPVAPQSTPSPVTYSSGGGNANVPGAFETGTPVDGTTPTGTATGTPITPTPIGTGTPAPPYCAGGSLLIDGSPYLAPVLAQVNQDYAASCPGLALTLRSDGSRALNFVQQGRVGIADTDLTASATRQLVDHPIAALLYTLIASPDVSLAGLSSADIQGIYGGQITNWAQLGGPDERIIVIYPPPAASINAIFRAYVLSGAPVQAAGYTMRKDNPSLTAQRVAKTPGALSYVPLSALPAASVQSLAIDGVVASIQALTTGAYPFWSVEHLYTRGDGTTQAQSWIQFALGQQETNTLLASGVAPLGMLSPAVLLSHLPGPQF